MALPPIAASNIAAQAFRMAELAPLSSFLDASQQAEDARAHFTSAMGVCLEAADWSFASALVTLPQAYSGNEAVDDALPYIYQLPPNCLLVREVRTSVGFARWRRDAAFLRADRPAPLVVRYTREIVDEARLPQTFQHAVSALMAALLAPRWVSSRTKTADLHVNATDAMGAAKRADQRQASSARYDGNPGYTGDDWVAGAIY